jgi:hypothetical protein
MTVRIKTQEFLRNGVRMYRVLSIRGVLTKDKMNPQYVESNPSFWLTDSHKTIRLFDGTTLCVNGEYKSAVIFKIMNTIKIAGNRLHRINQEAYRAKQVEEAGKRLKSQVADTLRKRREDATSHDTPVKNVIFKI